MTTGTVKRPAAVPHHHMWMMEECDEMFMRIGRCSCGAYKYFVNIDDDEIIEKANKLNKDLEKMTMVTMTLPTIEEFPASNEPAGENAGNYSNFTLDDKIRIAKEARADGVRVVADRYHIKTQAINSWMRLAHDESQKNEPSSGAGSRKRNVQLPEYPSFDSAWPEMVQLRWLEVYRDMARER